MPIKAEAGKSNTPPVSVGSHQAVCYGVVAVGTQPSELYAARKKVVILWELPHERGDFGEKTNVPRVISKRYTLSLSSDKATLRKDLENWRGKPFTDAELSTIEIDKLIGANCLLSVQHEHKGPKTYANVTAVMPLTKGMAKAAQETPRLYFNLDEALETALVQGGEVSFPENMPEWLKNLCAQSEEWTAHVGGGAKPAAQPAPAAPSANDEVPF
jgi:hypothetical protein